MMRFVFTLSLLVGVSYTATSDGSDSAPADYSDCGGDEILVEGCKDQYLKYLENKDLANDLKDVPQISDPDYLLEDDKLTTICGADNEHASHLREYYECVFESLTDCLMKQNLTEINMPDGGRISEGVYELCQHKGHINISCIVGVETTVQKCYKEKTVTGEEQCRVRDALVECTEEHAAECDGGKYIVAFLEAGRPQLCGTGAGNRNIAAIWFLLLAVFTSFLAARV